MLSDETWTSSPVGWSDIECSSAWIAGGSEVASWFQDGSLLECGAAGFAGEKSIVVCSENILPIENGPVLISRIDLAQPPPRGPESPATFTYALVLDGDGNPDNNFEYQGTFTLDIFQGTDRWYSVGNDPESGEVFLDTIDARAGGFASFGTAARAILFKSSVVFVIPVSAFEASPDGLRLRQTAFSFETGLPIDGTGSMDTAGADGPAFVDIPLMIPETGPDIFSRRGPRAP